MVFLLDPFVFLESHNVVLSYLSILVISFTLTIGVLRLAIHKGTGSLRQLIIIGAFYLIPLISGAVVLFMNYSEYNEVFLYLSTFLIIPILPISIYILWLIFADLQVRVAISAVSNENPDQLPEKLFRITKDSDQIILEVPINRIVTFEANDNYVITYHLTESGIIEKEMHRISLKKITEILKQIDVEFIRVHKSFLLNPDYIQAVSGKSQAYRIEVQHLPKSVPVSRAFDITQITK